MPGDDQQALREAVGRKAGAVISFPSGGGALRHHKTRLLAAREEGFWVQCPPDENELIERLMAGGGSIGLSVKAGTNRVMSATMILQFRAGAGGNAGGALLLAWPAELKALQRRADFRVTVFPGTGVSVQAWRIANHHYIRERPASSALMDVTLRNLSLGGMGVRYCPEPEAKELEVDQRIRIMLCHPAGELLIDGRVKHRAAQVDSSLVLGIQFRKLEDAIEGRQTRAALTQIIGQLQRDEIRRARSAEDKQKVAAVDTQPVEAVAAAA